MAKLTGLFQPRNALEHALVAAAADPTRRGDFVRELFDAIAAWSAGDDPESLVDFVVVTPDSQGIAAWL